MDRRALALVAAIAALLAVALVTWVAPDAGPPIDRTPRTPTPTLATTRDAPSRPRPAIAQPKAETDTGDGFVPFEQPPNLGPARLPPALADLDPDEVHRAELSGMATVALQRRDRLVECWEAFRERVGPDEDYGRFTIEITVSPGENDAGKVDTHVPNPAADEALSDCVHASLADAKFASPGTRSTSMVWPVPVPERNP